MFLVRSRLLILSLIIVSLIVLAFVWFNRANRHQAFIGEYRVYVSQQGAPSTSFQLWNIKFDGGTGFIIRASADCLGSAQSIGTETLRVLSVAEGRPPIQLDARDKFDSLKGFKRSIKFSFVEDGIELPCTLTAGWTGEWPLISCYIESNVYRYITMRIDPDCSQHFKNLFEHGL